MSINIFSFPTLSTNGAHHATSAVEEEEEDVREAELVVFDNTTHGLGMYQLNSLTFTATHGSNGPKSF